VLEENIQYHRSYRFHNSTQRPSRFSKHPASTSRWEISPSLSLLTHKTTIPQKRFPISIRLDYFSQGNFKRKNRKHPVVIELAGTPNGGKDITLLALQDYLTDYCGLKVRFIDEGIKSCHIDKAFDIDRLYKTIALAVLQLYEAKYENPGDYDVVLINRGIFDRLAFLSAMLALGKISAEQERIHREYLLSYADLQEYTAILLISPSESMQREWISKRKIVQVLAEESGMERSLKEQTLHKEEILANFNTSYLTTYRNYFHHFRGQAYLLDFRDQGNIDAKMIVQVMLEIINPGEKMQLPLPSLVAEVYRQESLEKKLAKVGSKRTTPKKKNIKNHTFTLPGLDEIYFKHPICELQSAA
jgi:hypothetical protein